MEEDHQTGQCFYKTMKIRQNCFPYVQVAFRISKLGHCVVYATKGSTSVCNKNAIQPFHCDHEEADSRIFVHLKYALENDFITTACIMSNDSVIVIIATSLFHELQQKTATPLAFFWNAKKRRWIPIYDLATSLECQTVKDIFSFMLLVVAIQYRHLEGKVSVSVFKHRTSLQRSLTHSKS